MFNAPRRTAGTSLASSAFLNTASGVSSGGGFDPLAQSTPNPTTSGFGEVDPWSTVPSPARSGTPRRDDVDDAPLRMPSTGGITAREGLNQLISDPPSLYLSLADQLDPSGSGYISLASVQRLFHTSKLPASTVEKIISVTSRDQSSLSRSELFCALALVALAQSSPDLSEISIERLSASLPNLPLPSLSTTSPSPSLGHADTERSPQPHGFAVTPGVGGDSASPWDTAARQNGNGEHHYTEHSTSAVEAAAERGYWTKLETVQVSLIPEKEGWFLQKYQIESDKRNAGALSRRYTDFVWLLDILTKRYPFRLLPSLPPKRIGPDATFLEARRKGLRRFINMLVNHPVTRDDGALNVFLTEPNFEAWRKRTKVSTDEESASKKLNPAQEMGIPADLEEKLGLMRDHLPALLASYQKLVVLAERSLARLQAASADASRIALSLRTVGEEMPSCCYRCVPGGNGCSLCIGVGRGLGEVGESWTRVAEEGEKRATAILLGNIEALKSQRDLYLAFRDLFVRHDRLSKDSVESLRKKVETRSKKIEALRAAAKPNWETEVDKLVAASDTDTATINTLLARRVFVRACMWHELAVVFHSRQAAQATLGWRAFAAEQEAGESGLVAIWQALKQRLQSMPVE